MFLFYFRSLAIHQLMCLCVVCVYGTGPRTTAMAGHKPFLHSVCHQQNRLCNLFSSVYVFSIAGVLETNPKSILIQTWHSNFYLGLHFLRYKLEANLMCQMGRKRDNKYEGDIVCVIALCFALNCICRPGAYYYKQRT